MFYPRQIRVNSKDAHAMPANRKRKAAEHLEKLATEVSCNPKQKADASGDIQDVSPIYKESLGLNKGTLLMNDDSTQIISTMTNVSEEGIIANDSVADVMNTSEVKQRSDQQRPAVENEPICIICGKYGEYVCNDTEEDVCSLECKAIHLSRVEQQSIHSLQSYQVSNPSTFGAVTKPVTNQVEMALSLGKGGFETTEKPNHAKTDPVAFSHIYKESYTYREHEAIAALSDSQISMLCNQLGVTDDAASNNWRRPVYEFFHCTSDALERNLRTKSYVTPTPVQMQVIPYALSENDLIVCSATASGKTLSFLLPMITRIASFYEALGKNTGPLKKEKQISNPLGLILAPTRELASQIEEEAKSIAKGVHNIKTALLIGGVALPPQLYRLKQDIQIIIATPGRLCDILLLDDCPLALDYVQTVVIDEVDCMLRMGFQAQMDKLWSYLPKHPQIMMFSATIPDAVKRLSQQLCEEPITVIVGSPSINNSNIKHIIMWVEENSKKKKLFQILDHEKHFHPPVLIFVESKIGAELLEDAINKMTSRSCLSLHGDKNQKDRFDILNKISCKEIDVVVATGVLGRGLDLISVKQIIHFDFPRSMDEFIHRSGRAGRLGTRGIVISFLNNSNKEVFCDLYDYLVSIKAQVPPELEHSSFRMKRSRGKSKVKKYSKEGGEMRKQTNANSLMSLLLSKRK